MRNIDISIFTFINQAKITNYENETATEEERVRERGAKKGGLLPLPYIMEHHTT